MSCVPLSNGPPGPISGPVAVAALGFLLLCAAAGGAEDYYLREPDAPKIPNGIFKIADYGGVGDGKTLNTEAFRKAMDACAKAGGGSVVVPAGTYLTGPITMAGRTALVLEKDAVLQASDQFSAFDLPNPLPATQAELDALERQTRPIISGADLTDVVIRGEGTIDGAGAVWCNSEE